jgi:hypothetical protein
MIRVKATSVIAVELGVSAKTVSRRLTRMRNNYLIELSIEWYPDASNDMLNAFHVHLKPDANLTHPTLLYKNITQTPSFTGGSATYPTPTFSLFGPQPVRN